MNALYCYYVIRVRISEKNFVYHIKWKLDFTFPTSPSFALHSFRHGLTAAIANIPETTSLVDVGLI